MFALLSLACALSTHAQFQKPLPPPPPPPSKQSVTRPRRAGSAPPAAAAATPTPQTAPDDSAIPDDEEVVTVETDLVTVPVVVTDGRGAPLVGLNQNRFAFTKTDARNGSRVSHALTRRSRSPCCSTLQVRRARKSRSYAAPPTSSSNRCAPATASPSSASRRLRKKASDSRASRSGRI
jgi:hypothetical protein